jgi:flagellin
MPSVINTNLASSFAQNALSGAQKNLATSVQRLSSGLRINSAKDDAAGLSVAQNMQSQINAINMAGRNINDATNMLTTADSSLGTIQDILLRMKTLAVEGKNDGLSGTQRQNIFAELEQLNAEISSISTKTTFNGNSLLSATNNLAATGTTQLAANVVGSSAGPTSVVSSVTLSPTTAPAAYTFSTTSTALVLTSGANSQTVALSTFAAGNNTINFSTFGISLTVSATAADTVANQLAAFTGDVLTVTGSAASLSFQSGAANTDTFTFTGLDTRTVGGSAANYTGVNTTVAAIGNLGVGGTSNQFNTAFNNASTAIDTAITQANTDRAVLGSQMNRLGYISTALMNQSTNTSASRSAIIDTDFASETAGLTKGQIMQQAATAMLAQANQMPNVILSLLK